MSIRIVLCDDHAVLRAGLKALLQSEPGLVVVGEAADGFQAVDRVLALRPDVAVVDITMPGQDGLAAARQIRRSAPEVKILFLTMHDDGPFIAQALEAGADGYVLKRAADVELIDAIREVQHGDTFVGSEAIRRLADQYMSSRERGEVPLIVETLTTREEEVLRLLARGYTNHEIADELVISVKTVETHRAHILGKLGVRKRAELVRYAQTHGLLAADAV